MARRVWKNVRYIESSIGNEHIDTHSRRSSTMTIITDDRNILCEITDQRPTSSACVTSHVPNPRGRRRRAQLHCRTRVRCLHRLGLAELVWKLQQNTWRTMRVLFPRPQQRSSQLPDAAGRQGILSVSGILPCRLQCHLYIFSHVSIHTI